MNICVDCGEPSTGNCCQGRTATAQTLEGALGPQWQRYFKPSTYLVVNYGGGENSVGALLYLYEKGIRPFAIVQADPGSETPRSITFRDQVLRPWLKTVDWPDIAVISRESEAFHGTSRWKGTLYDDCFKKQMLPSAAYGLSSCSQKFKAEPMHWWLRRQGWAQQEWREGRQITRVIGYDAGESRRVNKRRHCISGRNFDVFEQPLERVRYRPWYPLYDGGWTRQDCVAASVRMLGTSPGKSSCTFCPNQSLAEWQSIRENYPAEYQQALDLEENAAPNIDKPEVVGLVRRNPAGKRQLRLLQDCRVEEDDDTDGQTCECSY